MSLGSLSSILPALASTASPDSATSSPDPDHPHGLRPVQERQLQQLCATLKDWLPDLSQLEGVAGIIDAYLLAPSRWSYRDGDPFHPGDEEDPETLLSGTDAGAVPLLIRPWPRGVPLPANFPLARYEVMAGSRRLMARLRWARAPAHASSTSSPFAQTSSFDEVMAETVISVVLLDLDDKATARVIFQSNQAHKPLCPYEFGRSCKTLLADGVFKTQKELAQTIGRQESEISRGITLAGLDPVLLGAFRSPGELHYTDGPDLQQAWEKDPAELTRRALVATQHRGELKRKAVMAILLGTADEEKPIKVPSSDIEIIIEGVLYFVISTNAKGKTKVKVIREHVPPEGLAALARALLAMATSDHQDWFKPE